MRRGKLYGVGVGPGDPELVTRKAERILKECDIVAVPDKGQGEKTALNIVADMIEGKPLLFCYTPMIRDRAQLNSCYDRIADTICMELQQGKMVAFITLGDPTIYSTYIYIHRRVQARGYEVEMIAGVPSFCATAAKLNIPLCENNQRLMIVPASHQGIEDCLDMAHTNLVFMKAGREISALRETLREHNRLDYASMVENCGMVGEHVYPRFADSDDSGYFSVVVVKEAE